MGLVISDNMEILSYMSETEKNSEPLPIIIIKAAVLMNFVIRLNSRVTTYVLDAPTTRKL